MNRAVTMPPPAAAPAAQTYTLRETGPNGLCWQLALLEDRLHLTAADGSAETEVLRDEHHLKIEIIDNLLVRRLLILHLTPKSQAVFRLDAPTLAVIRQWLGTPTAQQMAHAVKKRLVWAIPLGLALMVWALPWTKAGWQNGVLHGTDQLSLWMGLALTLIGLAVKWRPHRAFFLAEILLLVGSAIYVAWRAMSGESWVGWTLLLLLQAGTTYGAIQQFRHYSHLRHPLPRTDSRRQAA